MVPPATLLAVTTAATVTFIAVAAVALMLFIVLPLMVDAAPEDP